MKFSQIQQRVGNRFKQRIVPIVNGIYGAYSKLATVFGNPITISDASNKPLQGLRIFGKSTQDGTPTPDAPVEIVSVENPTVNICGKNLLNIIPKTQMVNGVTFTISNDGSVTVNGTASKDIYFDLAIGIEAVQPNTLYYLSGCPSGGADATYLLRVSDKTTQAYDDYGDGHDFSYPDVSKLTVTIRIKLGTTVKNLVFTPMISLASTVDKSFEKYNPSQPLTMSNTLHGIPVTSGGNYTDADGQQWICDEIDFERGVYVQRIFRKVFDGTETLRNNWFPIMVHEIESPTFYADVDSNVICNYFDHTYIGNVHGTTLTIGSLDKLGYTNVSEIQELMVSQYEEGQPVILQYCLKTPIETPLTADQIAAYKALHTNEPNTTILNNQNAEMEVTYIKN